MIVVVAPSGSDVAAVSLDDADDCTAFHLEARGVDAAGVAAALAHAGVGRVSGDDAFIERAPLERMATAAGVGSDWQERYHAMLAYAAKKGWLDHTGAVQAHIEWQ